LPDDGQAPQGLRERKKAKRRSVIQHHALRLFREQGYDATTVRQIAEAAEVSESTFFRYFPTKEDVVLWDDFDPLLIEAVRRQPPSLTPLQALRIAFRSIFGALSAEEMEEQRTRIDLALSVPALRSAEFSQFVSTMPTVCALIAERTRRSATDLEVRAFAGAVIGVTFSTMLAVADDPGANWVGLIDEALGLLEAGLPL
jgi:AcrR family transcriptional regulator